MRRAAVVVTMALLLAPACGGRGAPESGRGETIRFTTDDGLDLAGEVRGEGDVGVVLAHMFPTDRQSWSSFADLLAQRGFSTLAFDFRGYGESEGERDISQIWRDVIAAVREFRGRGVTSVVVIGASMGGTAALLAASRERVDGVATLSAPSTFMGLSAPSDVLSAVTAPKLFIAADADGVAAQTAQAFYQQSSPSKRVEIVTGNEHGTDMLEGRQSERVRRLLLDFLARVEAAP